VNCAVCGVTLSGRRHRRTCSTKCRVTLSRSKAKSVTAPATTLVTELDWRSSEAALLAAEARARCDVVSSFSTADYCSVCISYNQETVSLPSSYYCADHQPAASGGGRETVSED
jgi:hypothetical protein